MEMQFPPQTPLTLLHSAIAAIAAFATGMALAQIAREGALSSLQGATRQFSHWFGHCHYIIHSVWCIRDV